MADVPTTETRPRRRWGRRLLIAVILLLVILVIGLVVLDRVAVGYAEREVGKQVAQQLADQQATAAKPEVTIDGVPFLTQVVAGEYHDITILLRDFVAPADNNRTIRMPVLDIRAKNVRAPLETLRTQQGDIVAGSVTGTGTLAYADVAALTGQDGLTLTEQNGKVVGTAPVQVLGQTFNVSGQANLSVEGDIVRVRLEGLTAEGLPAIPLVQNLMDGYAKRLSLDLTIPALPLQMKVQKVEPRPEGIVVTAAGTEVSLNTAG